MKLWKKLKELKEEVDFVDLSHPLSENTPHWAGFNPLEKIEIYNFKEHKFTATEYKIVSQFGTHIDAPGHFAEGGRMLHELEVENMFLPLVVMDFSKEADEDPDYVIEAKDILTFEEEYGRIPSGTFVALRTDWSKRKENFDNIDEDGIPHYPGWSMEAVKLLIEERKVAAIGHETSDTDASCISVEAGGLPVETYVLEQDIFQVELMANLDQMPTLGGVIVLGYPKVINGPGFTVRCIGVKEKE
ncbi:MAG: cyclase family protein [Tissierellia bacterium]|nr:cyclase family protein [Tissierellia bacterium]